MKYFFSLSVLILLISCSSTPMPVYEQHTNPVIVPLDFFGVAHAGMNLADEEFQLLDEMNVVWILHTFNWHIIEREKGTFDFSRYDPFVNRALQEGKKIVVVLAYSNNWVDDSGNNRYIPERHIPDYLSYVEAIVLHYKDKITAWQIWNEPNTNNFWKGTNEEFYNLSRQTAQKIRELTPEAYIIGGGLMRTPVSFIKGMSRAGALENLDALAFHPYALNPSWSMRLYDNLTVLNSKLNFSGDIFITEIGFPTGGWYPHRVSMKNLPAYVVKTIAGSAARGARALLWFQFSDNYIEGEYPNKIDSELYFGLTYRDFTRKNGAWAYQICALYLPGSRYAPELPVRERIPNNIVSFCFMDGINGNTLILWNDGAGKRRIKISVGSSFTAHNISTGENTVFQNETFLEVSKVPVIVTWDGSSAPGISSR